MPNSAELREAQQAIVLTIFDNLHTSLRVEEVHNAADAILPLITARVAAAREQAVDVLIDMAGPMSDVTAKDAIARIRALSPAPAAATAEPVAWVITAIDGFRSLEFSNPDFLVSRSYADAKPLYDHPTPEPAQAVAGDEISRAEVLAIVDASIERNTRLASEETPGTRHGVSPLWAGYDSAATAGVSIRNKIAVLSTSAEQIDADQAAHAADWRAIHHLNDGLDMLKDTAIYAENEHLSHAAMVLRSRLARVTIDLTRTGGGDQ